MYSTLNRKGCQVIAAYTLLCGKCNLQCCTLRKCPLCRPSSVDSDALPCDISPSSSLHTLFSLPFSSSSLFLSPALTPLFSYLLSSLLSHFHSPLFPSLNISLHNTVLAIFRLQHIKRRLRCFFNGYTRVNIYKRRPEVLSTTPHTSAPSSPPSYTLHISLILPNIPSHYIAFVFYSVLATFRLLHIKSTCAFSFI